MTNIDLEKCYKVEFAKGITLVMHWIITNDSDEEIDLPGEDYDPKEDYKPKYTLKDDVQEWLDNNVTGTVYIDMGSLYFEVAEDAMAFKLRWL